MTVLLINPSNGVALKRVKDSLTDGLGNEFPIVDEIPRIAKLDNYSESFGFQWNRFIKTQLDRSVAVYEASASRFFSETKWLPKDLDSDCILEVGSGAGRFSRVILTHTKAMLYSVDYSNAVTANFANNGTIAPARFQLLQASVYELPFPDSAFDKVFCFGVLQHVPHFERAVKALITKVKPGGEVVVDFYPIKGWWTKASAKYFFRPFLKKMSHERLLKVIESNIDWLINLYLVLYKYRLGRLTRFLPICSINGSFPKNLSAEQLREWAILDTFDMFSPEHDHPQKIQDVAAMFERHGAQVTFSGFEKLDSGGDAAVVRGIRR
ncbi:MAG: class I SAM-dependent methyltransferase [Candidatus Methylopumilus sp.]|nr:class I SAM-dependent methyltransferase [Candidatus Methylopumilus sp.]